MLNDDVANEARSVLSRLYELQRESLGASPAFEAFFPINLEQIVREILGWEMEERTMIGFLPSGQQIIGQSNFEQKKILIDIGDTDPKERNFTIAHEIGHAILHSVNYSCDAFATRVRSNRKNEKLSNSDPSRRVLEREAQMFAAELLMPRKSVTRYFRIVFGRDRLWVESTRTREFVEQAGQKFQPHELMSVARVLARVPALDGGKTLADFFGVSNEAMSVRLIRLAHIF